MLLIDLMEILINKTQHIQVGNTLYRSTTQLLKWCFDFTSIKSTLLNHFVG